MIKRQSQLDTLGKKKKKKNSSQIRRRINSRSFNRLLPKHAQLADMTVTKDARNTRECNKQTGGVANMTAELIKFCSFPCYIASRDLLIPSAIPSSISQPRLAVHQMHHVFSAQQVRHAERDLVSYSFPLSLSLLLLTFTSKPLFALLNSSFHIPLCCSRVHVSFHRFRTKILFHTRILI